MARKLIDVSCAGTEGHYISSIHRCEENDSGWKEDHKTKRLVPAFCALPLVHAVMLLPGNNIDFTVHLKHARIRQQWRLWTAVTWP